MRERFMPLQLSRNFAKNFVESLPRNFPSVRAPAGQAAVPEFHQLNVKAWLMRRIQIALITRYADVFRASDRIGPQPLMP
jgi:hypothetical protein